jgi:hypothetical protein
MVAQWLEPTYQLISAGWEAGSLVHGRRPARLHGAARIRAGSAGITDSHSGLVAVVCKVSSALFALGSAVGYHRIRPRGLRGQQGRRQRSRTR